MARWPALAARLHALTARRLGLPGLLAGALVLAACGGLPTPAPTAPALASITLTFDGRTQTHVLPAELTVREALAHLAVPLGELDRLTPAAFTRLSDGLAVTIVRVRETFETEQAVVPFASETIKNDGLPAGERRLLQAGANGLEEITYRTTFEDGVQISRSIIRRVFLEAPVAEIIMVGAQSSFTIVPITGTLAYLDGNNAWLMRGNSGQRLPLTTSGDLDGRIFNLSADGEWLLFTRAATDTQAPMFNSLWALTTTAPAQAQPIDLQVANVLYAEWSPTVVTPTIAFSTAEKTSRAPGWQANNDLWLMSWSPNRLTRRYDFARAQIVDSSSGGLYGWWGTGYALAPDGARIAYARTDSIGVIDLATGAATPLAEYTAYNTRSDWAWYPALNWAPGGIIYTVAHGGPLGLELPEDSPVFNLIALSAAGRLEVNLIPRAGMFANPVVAPLPPHRVAFLQAVDPNSSPFSRYRLGVMDRDGSNLRLLFPPEDQPGLQAGETPAWSPDGRLLAVVAAGNLWLIDADSGIAQQLTGDGLSQKPQWGR